MVQLHVRVKLSRELQQHQDFLEKTVIDWNMKVLVIGKLPLKFVEDGRRAELPIILEVIISTTPQDLANNQMEIPKLTSNDYYQLEEFFLKVFPKTLELQYWSRHTEMLADHEMAVPQWSELFSYKPPIKGQAFKNVKMARSVAQD